MKHKLLAVILLLSIVTALPSVSCKNHEETATQVASEWTSNKIAIASQLIALAIISEIPVITDKFASQIEDQINEKVTWTYPKPSKLSDNSYRVTPHAKVTIGLPLIGDYSISVDLQLTIDTEQERVTDYSLDAGSFRFNKE